MPEITGKTHLYVFSAIIVACAVALLALAGLASTPGAPVKAAPLTLATCHTYTSSDTPKEIPDYDSDGISSVIAVGDTNYIHDITVSVNISHTSDNNLRIWLLDPATYNHTLSLRNGGSGANYVGTSFNDRAGTAIASGSAPFTGSYRPETPLGNLGKTANGNWTLNVVDDVEGDTGSLLDWSITLCTDTVTPTNVPPPTRTVGPTRTPIPTDNAPCPTAYPTMVPGPTSTGTPPTPIPTGTLAPTGTPGVSVDCYGGENAFSPGAFRCYNPVAHDNYPNGPYSANNNMIGCLTSSDTVFATGIEVKPDKDWSVNAVEFLIYHETGFSGGSTVASIYEAPRVCPGHETGYHLAGNLIATSEEVAGAPEWTWHQHSLGNGFFTYWYYSPPTRYAFADPVVLRAGQRYWLNIEPKSGWDCTDNSYDMYSWESAYAWPPDYTDFASPNWMPSTETDCRYTVSSGEVYCHYIGFYGPPPEPPYKPVAFYGAETTVTPTPTATPVPTATPAGWRGYCYTIKPDNLDNQLQFFWWDEWPGWNGGAMPLAGTAYLKDTTGKIIDQRHFETPVRGRSWAATSWTNPSGTWWSYPPSPGHTGNYVTSP